MIITVHSYVDKATGMAGITEVIDLVGVVAVNRITPGLDCNKATQVIIVATLSLYPADEVVTAVEGMAECLPVIT